MEIEKIRKGVYAELPKLLEVVKIGAIAREAGVSHGWVSGRLHRAPNGPYCIRKFREGDMEKINRGLWALGEKLMAVNIPWSADRKECVTTLKETLKDVFVSELISRKLGITLVRVSMYMTMSEGKTRRPQFSEEEIQQIMMGVREIGLRLVSTELYLDEE